MGEGESGRAEEWESGRVGEGEHQGHINVGCSGGRAGEGRVGEPERGEGRVGERKSGRAGEGRVGERENGRVGERKSGRAASVIVMDFI